MFAVNNTKVYFSYGTLPVNLVQDALGIQLPRRFQDYDKELNITYCLMEEADGHVRLAGVAVCSPQDNFFKDRGRKEALADALKSFPKEVRYPFWKEYFDTVSEKYRVAI